MPAFERLSTQFLDDNGDPLLNGKLYVGVYGLDPVANPVTIYSDAALTTPLTNPQTLDSFGRPANDVYVSSDFSYKVEDSGGTQIELKDVDIVSDYVRYAADTGAANAYVISVIPPVASYQPYQAFQFIAANDNTGDSTLNINGLGVQSILTADGQELPPRTILAGGLYTVVYDGSNFILQGTTRTSSFVDVKRDFGAVGDNTTDDAPAFQAAFDYCAAVGRQVTLHIPEGTYRLADRITATKTFDITCDKTASIRWDSVTASEVGILLDFEGSGDTLTNIELPQLFGPGISSGFSFPGYGSGTQDLTTRIGIAVNLKGGNRMNIKVLIANGFGTAFKAESTSSSTVDNVNFECNTSDLCEKFIELDVTGGFGMAQMVAKANTVFAKYPIYIDATTGYVNGANIDIAGTAFVNEDGGCGIYIKGHQVRSSTFRINQIQAGKRADSRSDTIVMLTPTGTMAAAPVQGETITQAGTGATGVVVTNADYTLGDALPFSIEDVSGTFNTSGQLTGSSSGALGANSVPASVRGLVCPWLGGDQSMNGVTYDAEQSGTIGYAATKHCSFVFGAAMSHPAGGTDGAFSNFPQPGESVRIRDNGLHNQIEILNGPIEAGEAPVTAVALSTTEGEANFDGGVGSAKWNDIVYCNVTLSSLAAGSAETFFFYHSQASDNSELMPCEIIPVNDVFLNNNLVAAAFWDGATNNRQIKVRIKNNGGSPYSGNPHFYIKVNG